MQQAHALGETICIVRLRIISAQKLVLISYRVARIYVSVSDRRVSYGFLTCLTIGLNSYVSLTVGRNDKSKFTEGSWQGSMKEQFEMEIQNNAWREFLQSQNLFLKLPTGFPASSNRCRCNATKENHLMVTYNCS